MAAHRTHTPGRLAAPLALALALVLLLVTRTVSADIKLIDLDPFRGMGAMGDAYRAGFMAAFDGKTVATHNIIFLPRNPGEALNDIDTILTRVLASDPDVLAITGAIGVAPVAAMMNSTVAAANHLVALGSSSPLANTEDFNRNLIFYDSATATRGLGLMQLAVEDYQVRTHTAFYDVRYALMPTMLRLFNVTLREAGQPLAAAYQRVPGAPFSPAQTQALIASMPQVIYVFADGDAVLTEFLRTVWSDARTAKTKIFALDILQPYFETTLPALKSQHGISVEPGQVLLAASTASSTDTNMTHVQQFHQEMKAYIDAGSSAAFTDSTILTSDTSLATTMLAGWVSGTITLAMLLAVDTVLDRAAFQRSVYSQKRLIAAGDLFYGTFSDTCTPAIVQNGWPCECNQGGRVMYYRQLNDAGQMVTIPGSRSQRSFGSDACHIADTNPRLSFANGVIFSFTDPELVNLSFIVPVFTNLLDTMNIPAMNYVVLETSAANMQAVYDAYYDTHKVDFVLGLMPDSRYDPHGATIYNPISRRPVIPTLSLASISPTPTAKQQVYTFYTFLDSKGDNVHHPIKGKAVTVIMKDIILSQDALYRDFFAKSAATFDIPDPTVRTVDASTVVTSQFATKGYNFVAGIDFRDTEPIADFLEQNPEAAVVLFFTDFSNNDLDLLRAMRNKDASVSARLLSMTNFPLWSDTSAEARANSTLLRAFQATQPPGFYTSARMSILVTTLLLQNTIGSVQGPTLNTFTLLRQLFRDRFTFARDLRVGPFTTCNATLDTTLTAGSACEDRNYGAFEVTILSAQRVLDPTQPANLLPVQPSLVYRDRPKRLSKGAIAGIVVGSVAFIAIIVAIIVVLFCCLRKNARDNKNAPTDPNEPVTMIFTDIESSTALWAHIPTIMPDAVAKHHSVIRGIIAAYKCYEVKTIGDSFMIACKSATTAAELACAMQTALLAADYGTTEIDDAYREMELQREADDDEQTYKAHTAHLPPDAYASMWSGLRVRMGVHTGLCEVRYDEVSKGYDYYGETVNMAARTEAIGNGGQVILTGATWDALSDEVRSDLHHTPLGPVGLRGVPQPVHMFQVDAIAGRRFAPLRTEIEAVLPDEGTEINSSAMGTSASMNVASILVSNVIKTLLAPFRSAQRVKEMRPFLARWGIPVPNKPQSVTVDDYNTFLTNRLAIKVAAVYQRAHGRTAASAELPSYAGSNRATDLVQIALNQLPSRRGTEHGADPAQASLPRVFIDDANGSLHDVRRGSRSLVRRLAKRFSARENSTSDAGNHRSDRSNVALVSDYSAVSTVDVQPFRAPAGIRVGGGHESPGGALYEVPGSVEMTEKRA